MARVIRSIQRLTAATGVTTARIYTWRFLKGVYHKADEHHMFLMSGGLAFSLLFCIVPLGLVAFAVLGLVLEKTAIINEVGSIIDKAVPYPEFASYIKSIVFARAQEFRVYKNVAGLIGMLGLLLAASGLFSSMRTVLNSIFRVREGSPIYKDKIRDLGIMLLVLAYFILSVGLVPLSDVVLGLAGRFKPLQWLDLALIERYLVHVVTIVLILGGYVTMYFAIPQRALSFRATFIAGLSATILWFAAKEVFGLYIIHAANLREIYGTYVVLVMLGLWIYYSSLVFILGAIIGQVYRELRTQVAAGTLAETPTAAE